MTSRETIKVSFVVTLYNKEKYIKETALSLINQSGDFEREYIFIDDNSTDESVEVLKEVISDIPSSRIILNQDNRGPSVRLNEAAEEATGDFIFFFDSDDLLLPGAISMMLELMISSNAEFIHGKHCRDSNAILTGSPEYKVIEKPCRYVLNRSPLILTTGLARKEVFQRANGCDEEVFIQDLSLNLNLACASARMIDLKSPIMIRLEPETNLTKMGGSAQAHHDGFLTFRHFSKRMHRIGHRKFSALANRRAISYGWKHVRSNSALMQKFGYGFLYLLSRANACALNDILGMPFEHLFSKLEGIRKSTPRAAWKDRQDGFTLPSSPRN